MKRTAPPFAAACLLLFATLTGVTTAQAQSAVDEHAVIATVSALDAALDARDWDRVRVLLLDEVTLALPGAEREAIAADELVTRWQEELHDGKNTFHLRGGERVRFDGADSVVVRSRAQVLTEVEGIAGDDLHELWSDYHHELDRTENGWRIRHYGFIPRLERGNTGVAEHRLPVPPPDDAAEADGDDAPDAGRPDVEPAVDAEPAKVGDDATDAGESGDAEGANTAGTAEPADTSETSDGG